LNFAPLENADAKLTASAERFTRALAEAHAQGSLNLDAQALASVNALLIESERKLTTPEGLPGRPWFKHQIYAPGAYTGYGVKTLPAVREAMDQEDWKLAQDQVPIVAKVLEDESALIDQVTGLLSPSPSASAK
jgi:N-acetylated-alpha-linked acidic dipeptidase